MINKYINSIERETEFQKIFNEYIQKKLWITHAIKFDPKDLAKFGDSENNLNYIINILTKKDNIPHYTTVFNALYLIRLMETAKTNNNQLKNIIMNIILNYHDKHEDEIKKSAIITLTDLKLNDLENISDIINKYKDNDSSWIRYGLYYMLTNSEYLDVYINIFIEGISYLDDRFTEDNHERRLVDEVYWLSLGLKNVTKVQSLKKVLKYFSGIEEKYYYKIDYWLKDYFKNISQQIISAYKEESSIFSDLISLITNFQKLYLIQYIIQLKEILMEINQLDEAFYYFYELLINSSGNSRYVETLAILSTKETCDYLLKEYKSSENKYSIELFRNYLNSHNSNDLYEWFSDELEKVSDGKIKKPKIIDYEKKHDIAISRYIQLLFDDKNYMGEINKIITLFNEDIIEDNFDILHDIERKYIEESNGVENIFEEFRLIIWHNKQMAKNRIILSFNNNLERIYIKSSYELLSGKKDYFKYFADEQISKIIEWCFRAIKSFNFKSVLEKSDNGFTANINSIYVFFFMKKFNIEFSKETILDTLSFDWLGNQGLNEFYGIDYLEFYLEKNIISIEELENRILENIKSNIEIEIVIKKHILISLKYNLLNKEILSYIKNILLDKRYDDSLRRFCIEIYYNNHKDKKLTANLFTDITDIFKWEICDFLLKKDELTKLIAKEVFINIIQDVNSTTEDKLKSSEFLIDFQDIKGINYYIDNIIEAKSLPGNYLDWSGCLNKIRIKEAAPKLLELLLLDYKKEIQYDEYMSLYSHIYNALKNIGSQSENNFNETKNLIQSFIVKNSDNEKINFLNQLIEDMEQEYYINKQKNMPVDEVKRLIDSIF